MADAPKSVDKAAAQVQQKVDEETERGYRGVVPDETPNEHYTFKGAAAGKPTPETTKGA